ncbi:hypothetical protein [Colwellia echini]|uniref:GYF domain-containing protein n=1 Tax=Colwellia echini TaxID=1982103 RepID=A0ABY3N036_9GAMM|nr:hypothetical protein [Colwellia echini]TYK66779.1 hypothetical protein CWS31_003060 [Colwellia echini]
MNKWFFSDNGKITGPLDFTESKIYLINNPAVYGWHPSFTQWKPVNCINEFSEILPTAIRSPSISKIMSDQFIAKQKRLATKLINITDSINHSQNSLGNLDTLIEAYKDLTDNLNDDVKGAIDNIERNYNSLRRKLTQVRQAVSIAKKETNDAVDDFEARMSAEQVSMPICVQNSRTADIVSMTKASVIGAAFNDTSAQEDLIIADKPKLVSVKPEQRYEPQQMYRGAPVMKHEYIKSVKRKVNSPAKASTYDAENSEKESVYSVHGMMKSVFKGDSRFVD